MLDSLVEIYPANVLAESMIQSCRGKNYQFDVFNFVLECYSHKSLSMGGLEVYRKLRFIGFTPSVNAYNALLGNFEREEETKLAWCFYCAMIRLGVLPNKFSWSLVAHILCKDKKFEKIVKLLDMGIYSSFIYNAVIDYYSRCGDFEGAFYRLNEMCDRKFDPSFSTCSSILDGACKFREVGVIERIISIMVQKELLAKPPLSESNSIIQKLCHLGRVNAATMFFRRACDEKIGLKDATYGCMLSVLCKHGRAEEAIGLYRVTSESGITINDSAYHAFADFLCGEYQSEEGYGIMKDIMKRGFSPNASTLSKFILLLCNEQKWREAEELLNVVLEKGLSPDALPCCSLVEHYCSIKQIDKAVALHDRLEKMRAGLDVTSYNTLLDGLFEDGRIEESIRVFGYMKELKLVNSASFVIVIRGLCRAKEMRNAMKLHDEMLNIGLKPDKVTYKKLILEFKL